ncbi:MAG TPA: hypothetical protein VHP54_05155 [Caproiciproducens sp.]|nr:hypothetical protein [Caproiciproducens sp.]
MKPLHYRLSAGTGSRQAPIILSSYKKQTSLRLIFHPAVFSSPAGASPLSFLALQDKESPLKSCFPFMAEQDKRFGFEVEKTKELG